MGLFLQSIVNSFIQGGFFALWAVGLVLVFGVMRIVNFAHGELVMAGAYAIWVLHAQRGLPYLPSLCLDGLRSREMVGFAALGAGQRSGRRLARRGHQ